MEIQAKQGKENVKRITYAIAGEGGHVPTGRVGQGHVGSSRVKGPDVLGNHPEVVPMEMNRVKQAKARAVLDHQHRPVGRGTVDRDDVVLGGEDGAAIHHPRERRARPVKQQAAVVERPLEVTVELEAQALRGRGGDGADVERHVRAQARERLVVAARSRGDARGARRRRGAAVVIPDNTRDSVRVAVGHARVDPRPAQPVVARASAGLHDHVVPLAHGQLHRVGGVWLDGDEVVGDHGQRVPVDAELEVPVGRDVDEPDAVLLARLEHRLELLADYARASVGGGAVVCVGPVDEAVLHGRRRALLRRVPQRKGGLVRPVLQGDHPEVLVVVGRRRPVDDHGPKDAHAVLQAQVAVVPGGPVLRQVEAVCERGAGSDGALRDPGDAIRGHRVELPDAVPVDGGSVDRQVVCDVDVQTVSPVSL